MFLRADDPITRDDGRFGSTVYWESSNYTPNLLALSVLSRILCSSHDRPTTLPYSSYNNLEETRQKETL